MTRAMALCRKWISIHFRMVIRAEVGLIRGGSDLRPERWIGWHLQAFTL